MSMKYPPLAIIGGGTMGQAIVRGGMSNAGVIHRTFVVIAEPDEARHASLRQAGVHVVRSATEAIQQLAAEESATTGPGTGQVLLAIKPQMLAGLADEIRPLLAEPSRVVISILAGMTTQRVRSLLGDTVRVVRAMPNLPARIRQGTTAVCRGTGTRDGDDDLALEIFNDVGPLVVTIDEALMDAFTAVAGSGPAYVFYLAEAMVRAAVELGFDETMASDIVRETVAGAGALLGEAFESPEQLRKAVTSKGGTTEAAIQTLDQSDLQGAIIRAVAAARERGRTLAG